MKLKWDIDGFPLKSGILHVIIDGIFSEYQSAPPTDLPHDAIPLSTDILKNSESGVSESQGTLSSDYLEESLKRILQELDVLYSVP